MRTTFRACPSHSSQPLSRTPPACGDTCAQGHRVWPAQCRCVAHTLHGQSSLLPPWAGASRVLPQSMRLETLTSAWVSIQDQWVEWFWFFSLACANSSGITMENHKSGPSGAEAFYFLKATLRASRKNFLGCCSWMKQPLLPLWASLSVSRGDSAPLCSALLGWEAPLIGVWSWISVSLSLSPCFSLTFSFNPLGPKYFIKILINNSWQCTNGMYIWKERLLDQAGLWPPNTATIWRCEEKPFNPLPHDPPVMESSLGNGEEYFLLENSTRKKIITRSVCASPFLGRLPNRLPWSEGYWSQTTQPLWVKQAGSLAPSMLLALTSPIVSASCGPAGPAA